MCVHHCSSSLQNVPATDQMTVAMLLILWVSALASAFIDNIPFTTAIVSWNKCDQGDHCDVCDWSDHCDKCDKCDM